MVLKIKLNTEAFKSLLVSTNVDGVSIPVAAVILDAIQYVAGLLVSFLIRNKSTTENAINSAEYSRVQFATAALASMSGLLVVEVWGVHGGEVFYF